MAIQQFSQSLPMMLYRTLDVVMPRFRRIFKEFGLTEQQWRVLRVLWEQDRLAFHELASIALIPRPSLVGIIDRLRDAGLVERVRCEKDRRIVYVRVTAAGADIQEQVMPLVQQAYFELRLSVDDDVWHQLLDGLGQISSLEEGKHTG